MLSNLTPHFDDVLIRGVRDVVIETFDGAHADGIAVDSSRNVRITNCDIDTGGDDRERDFGLRGGKPAGNAPVARRDGRRKVARILAQFFAALAISSEGSSD